MTTAARPVAAHDPRVSGLLVQHTQAMKAGDFQRALMVLRQVAELEGGGEQPFPAIDAAAIFAPLEPVHHVIRDLDLCPGAPAMWAGYGYSGKTAAVQDAALTIASGSGTVWGRFGAAQGRVLHLDYEQGSRLTRERYQRLAVPKLIGPSDLGDRLSLVSMPARRLDQPQAEDEIERLCEGCTLVIVDSLRASAPSIDENSSEVRSVLDMLCRVSERTGAAFLVIHHARKPSTAQQGGRKMSIRGSGALFDACGSVLVFEGEKGKPSRVTHEKARTSGQLTEDFEIEITDVPNGTNLRAGLLVSATGALSQEEAADEIAKRAAIARSNRVVGELRELFAREPEQGGRDAIAAKIGRSGKTIGPALALLVSTGEVEAVGATKDRKHRWTQGH